MKKIIPFVCCMVFFSVTDCNADSDVEKLKGCWSSVGTKIEFGDNYEKNLNNGEVYKLKFETTDTHISIIYSPDELFDEEIFYINKKSITDTSFMRSKKEEAPDKGLQFNRIQCPSK